MPDIRYYIHQLRVLPAREIVRRAVDIGKRVSWDRIDKVKSMLFGGGISAPEFFERAFAHSDEHAILARLGQRPFFFIDASNLAAALPALSLAEKERIISSADRFCEHKFDLLGSGEMSLGHDIDWHCDFKTGYRWNPKTWYHDIKIPYGKADIKVPWELSRFSHAITLGQAYQLTRDEKYSREFAAQVTHWIDENQPKFGVNWACTMDVAIRACNWIAGYGLLRHSPSLTDAFLLKFLKSLYLHGIHIRENLEYSEALTSNHYLSNITGLIYLGLLFPESAEAKGWLDFGITELKQEMEKQVYPDGCDFEASTCYHRLVLELFFFPTLLATAHHPGYRGENFREATTQVFGKDFTERLRLMFNAILHLLKPNGRMPQLGDNDSGRLHVFADREILDMRYLLTLGAIFFHDPKFKVREFGFFEESLWVFGRNGQEIWDRLDEYSLADIPSIAFPDAGWYIMRNNMDYLIVSCGPNGQNNNGGHCHNDKLSFELMRDGLDVIVDPGTYVYTPEPSLRNRFRSTAVHHTVRIDEAEQNRYSSSPLFLFVMRNDSHASALLWESGEEVDRFIGEQYGYQKLPLPVVHQREIVFSKKERTWEIIDRFTGSGEHRLEWNFNLSPRLAGGEGLLTGTLLWRTESSSYSPEYGAAVKSARLTSRVTASMPFETRLKIGARS